MDSRHIPTLKKMRVSRYPVDGSEIRRSPVEVGSLSQYLQGFIHPRWCGNSSINSILLFFWVRYLPKKQPFRVVGCRNTRRNPGQLDAGSRKRHPYKYTS